MERVRRAAHEGQDAIGESLHAEYRYGLVARDELEMRPGPVGQSQGETEGPEGGVDRCSAASVLMETRRGASQSARAPAPAIGRRRDGPWRDERRLEQIEPGID